MLFTIFFIYYFLYPLLADLYGAEDSEMPDEYEIVLTESNRFKTSFHVPK